MIKTNYIFTDCEETVDQSIIDFQEEYFDTNGQYPEITDIKLSVSSVYVEGEARFGAIRSKHSILIMYKETSRRTK